MFCVWNSFTSSEDQEKVHRLVEWTLNSGVEQRHKPRPLRVKDSAHSTVMRTAKMSDGVQVMQGGGGAFYRHARVLAASLFSLD